MDYPLSGYAFNLPRGNTSLSLELWQQLIDAQWLSKETALTYLSLTAYDPSSNILVFADFSLQVFSTGTVVPIADVRGFQLPGVNAVESGLRYTTCAVSLFYLLAYLAVAAYRLWNLYKFEQVFTGWFWLDVATMGVIQGAVWSVIAVQLNPVSSILVQPAAIAKLTSLNYTGFVPAFANVSHAYKLEDFLLGISFLLLGFKLFKLFALYPNLSFAYSVIFMAQGELLTWIVLIMITLLFFTIGGLFMFGVNVAQFSTIGNALMLSIVYGSHISVPAQGDVNFDNPITNRATSALEDLIFPFSTMPVFSFVLWLGLFVIFVEWIARSILLGIVIDAFDRVAIENEALNLERYEREEAYAQVRVFHLFLFSPSKYKNQSQRD